MKTNGWNSGRWLAIWLLVGMYCGLPFRMVGAADEVTPPVRDTFSDTWVATDALGRSLPGVSDCGAPKPGKVVGIFYFLWLTGGEVYDITRLLTANPADPKYGPLHAFHWWGEPHLGYYKSDDEFVIRKHAQMLTDAGVDLVIFDVTNGFTYEKTYQTICRVYESIRQSGRTTPLISFIAHSSEGRVVQELYDHFYSKGLYSNLWFRWQGKPLMLAKPEALTPALREYFTVRESWAWSHGTKSDKPTGWFGDGREKWPWLDHYPQLPGWRQDASKPEQVSVCVAQHPVSNIGRSFHDGVEPPPEQRTPEKGICFSEQWKRALELNPEFVFVTGWNEWIAQRFISDKGGQPFLGKPLPPGGSFFVDQYNLEFSRDIEPMRGGYGDSYYCQLVANIRRFKGVRPLPAPSAAKTVDLSGGFDQWREVRPEFLDDLGDTAPRDHAGWGKSVRYTSNTGRNDFDLMKVARDEKNLYFYVRTKDPISPATDPRWMMLLIDADRDHRTGWEGYDYIVNRTVRDGSTGLLEQNVGGWKWEPVAEVKFVVKGNEMQLAIPRAALKLEPAKGRLQFDFKWADNIPESGNILDFIDQGDVAPNGRFNYRYEE